jgi:hypothetical protein
MFCGTSTVLTILEGLCFTNCRVGLGELVPVALQSAALAWLAQMPSAKNFQLHSLQ